MKKIIALVSVVALSGCSTMLCTGTGTCEATGRTADTYTRGAFTPTTVTLPMGTYVIVPDYNSGRISSVIQSGRGK